MPSRSTPGAFTLIELLVVITIIVVLLALLTPALDKAVYQAQLASCGAQLKAVAGATQLYAMGNGRRYPKRETFTINGGTDPGPGVLASNSAPFDDRQTMRQVFGSLKMLVDPLTESVDLESTKSNWVHSGYNLWFGMHYMGEEGGEGIRRVGDRLQWGNSRFDVLATDADFFSIDADQRSISSHPDQAGVLAPWVARDEPIVTANMGVQNTTFSRWENRGGLLGSGNGVRRGALDLNYAYGDGSVARHDGVDAVDDRMTRVPFRIDRFSWDVWAWQLPRQ